MGDGCTSHCTAPAHTGGREPRASELQMRVRRRWARDTGAICINNGETKSTTGSRLNTSKCDGGLRSSLVCLVWRGKHRDPLPYFRKGITLAKKGSDSQIQKGTRNERDEERGRRGVDADGLIDVSLQISFWAASSGGANLGSGGSVSPQLRRPNRRLGRTSAAHHACTCTHLRATCTLARQFCLSAAARCHARPLLGRSVRPHSELRDPPHHPCTHPSTR